MNSKGIISVRPAASALFVVATSLIAAAGSLDEIQKGFTSRYDELNQDQCQKTEALSTNYKEALNRLVDDVKKTGNLDPVVAIRGEITAIETGADPLPDLSRSSWGQLKSMRAKYLDAREAIIRAHAAALVDLADKTEELLKETESNLTKSGEVDEALAARRMRQTLGSDHAIESARNTLEPGGDGIFDRGKGKANTTRKDGKFAEWLATWEEAKVIVGAVEVVVPATAITKNRVSSRVSVGRGDRFIIIPNPEDTWSGGGTRNGKFCDYQGHYPAKNGNNWMRLLYTIGNSNRTPVDPTRIVVAQNAGVVELCTFDERPVGNKGEIRVIVLKE